VQVVEQRSSELLKRYQVKTEIPPSIISMLATVFREIREGKTMDGVSIKKPSTALSTAEAISIALDSALHARFFGNGLVGPSHIARNMIGSVVKEDETDRAVLKEYVVLVAKKRALNDPEWKEFHDAMMSTIS
jgi:hypothetical protein